jgi:hypothetical protein
MRAITMFLCATVLLGCTRMATPSVPSRVDAKWAADSAWAGLDLLGHECARQVRLRTAEGNFEAAVELGNACVAIDDPVEVDRQRFKRALRSWGPPSASQVGCTATDLVDAYDELVTVLEERGLGYHATPEVEYGRASAQWLTSLHPAGRCAGGS